MTEADERRWFALLRRGLTKREAAEVIGLGRWVFRNRENTDPRFAKATAEAVYTGSRLRSSEKKTVKVTAEVDATLQARVDKALAGLVTYTEAADALGVSREAVRMMARRGAIPRVETPAGPLVAVKR